MNSKKGAMELSMTTIIIIVLGVVLLSLGLAFVRGIFKKITDESDQIFAMSEEQITELFEDSTTLIKLVPDSATADIGDILKTGIVIKNIDDENLHYSLTTDSGHGDINCYFGETGTRDGISDTIAPGISRKYKLIADLDDVTPGTGNCMVTITPGDDQLQYKFQTSESFFITIEA